MPAPKIDPDAVRWSASESERAGRPLLVVLHGHGMDETIGSREQSRLHPDLVVAALRAPLRAGGGYGWFKLNADVTLADVDQSAAAVWEWVDGQSVTAVGVLGFSQGTATAFQMLRRRPHGLDYVVNLSGLVAPLPDPGDAALQTLRPPVFWGHGDQDRVIPAPLVTSSRTWLSHHATLTECRYPGMGHNVSTAELDDLRAFLRVHVRPAGWSSS